MNRKWLIFAVCSSLFLMSLFYRASSAIIAPQLMKDLKLTHEDLGLLGAAFFYTFALVQFPLGPVLDRLGPRITIAGLNLLATLGAIVFARAGSMAGGVLGRGLLGLGMAANLMGPLKLFTIWFPPNRFATMSGLLLSLGTLGSLAATSPLALMVEALGWRGSFYTLAAVNVLLVLFIIIIVRDTPEGHGVQLADNQRTSVSPWLGALKLVFSSWSYWAISLSAFIRYGSYVAIQALWAGPFLMEYLRLPTITAGNLLFLLSLGFIIGSPCGGLLSDDLLKSHKKTVILGSTLSAFLAASFSLWKAPVHILLLGTVFFSLGFFNSFGQVIYAHIKELMPSEMSASAMTAVNFFTMMGGGVFIHMLGSIMQRFGGAAAHEGHAYSVAFLVCAAGYSIATMLYFTTKESQAKSP